MITKNILFVFITLFSFAYADGLMLPANEGYPKDLLKNRMTQVTVNINGIVAETIVYQEFVNEWHHPVDAVYSFPLPEDARATNFLYWFNDTLYQAVLKVKEQATNPGTGEGGIAAEVNRYIGRNGIKIALKNIPANSIQKVELHYISLCDYYKGESHYKYPLDTQDFISYPYEHIQFNFNVKSSTEISSFDVPGQNMLLKYNDGKELHLEILKPKSYVNKDIEFTYQVNQQNLGVDFYSINNDTSDGHFALFIRPENEASADSILPKRVIFLISNSSSMAGYKFEESISATKEALDLLSEKDLFNIVTYANSTASWQPLPVAASTENIASAKEYLDNISTTYGWQMQAGIMECFNQISDDSLDNSIILFSDGLSSIDPREIESANSSKTGIFPIAIGDQNYRARLEMTASLNYGFVTYIDAEDNIHEKILRVVKQISQPLLKNTFFEFGGADVYELVPPKVHSTYAGSYLFLGGRYKNSGPSALSIAGINVYGNRAYDFVLDYAAQFNVNRFAESLWAKEKIDALEREIEIYGETPALKDSLIDISLKYNIRCRYTAYIADYENVYVSTLEDEKINVPISYMAGNFPNPFNPETHIRIFIDASSVGKTMLLKIYNILGQLVAVIDISNFTAGWHNVLFNGKDLFGNSLASGMYIVQLQVQNSLAGTIRIHLIK